MGTECCRWCSKHNLETYGVTPNIALRAYFLAAANIFEPDRAAERMGWARTAVLAEAVASQLRSSSAFDSTRILCKLAPGSMKRFEHALVLVLRIRIKRQSQLTSDIYVPLDPGERRIRQLRQMASLVHLMISSATMHLMMIMLRTISAKL